MTCDLHRPDNVARTVDDVSRARLVQQAVAFVFREAIEEISAPTRRSKRAAFARQTAMYLTHVAFGMSLMRVALAFGRDRTTVAHACHVVEDRRDDPRFDSHLETMEHFLRALPGPLDESRA